jgi:hypothetical protein
LPASPYLPLSPTPNDHRRHNAELGGRYLVEDGLAVAELPYLGGQLAMRVLVPDDLTRSSSGSTLRSGTASTPR